MSALAEVDRVGARGPSGGEAEVGEGVGEAGFEAARGGVVALDVEAARGVGEEDGGAASHQVEIRQLRV